jgi:hypothetical protein
MRCQPPPAVLKIDMLNTSIGSCHFRRRRSFAPAGPRLILVVRFILIIVLVRASAIDPLKLGRLRLDLDLNSFTQGVVWAGHKRIVRV